MREEQIPMAISFLYKSGKLGIAAYDNDLCHFILSNDLIDNNECEILKSFLYKLNINLILLSLELETERYKYLKDTGIEIVLVENATYRKVKIDGYPIDGINLSLYALNALLSYLDSNFLEFLDYKNKKISAINYYDKNKEDNLHSKIAKIGSHSIYLMNFDQYMNLDLETIECLDLIRFKKHPNLAMKTKIQNESLYKILDHCQTSFGSKRLKNWILFPLKDESRIEKRRVMIETILKNDYMTKLTFLLKKHVDLNKNEANFSKRRIKIYFSNIIKSIEASIQISKLFPNPININNLYEILTEIENTIDISPSNNFFIKNSINKNLDKLKSLYQNLSSYLDEVAKRVSKEYKIETSIVYYPQLGYLIETNEKINNLTERFIFGKKNYYKNSFMNSLDVSLGDIINKIENTEYEIVMSIKSKLDEVKIEISSLQDFIENVDCLNSLAISAQKYRMKRPKNLMKTENEISVKEFRNIIYEKKFKSIIPNDIDINKTTLITGPNGSGKSTFLKEIGVCVVLNQIGSYIPCKDASLTIFDNIFTRIKSNESVQDKKSAFFSDVLQINKVLRFSTEYSLFLCDEFGKGTNTIEGVSLFFSLLTSLKHPLCIYTTHYESFIDQVCDKEILEKIKIVTFKNYRIISGINDRTNVLNILKKFDIDKEFIDEYSEIKKVVETKNDVEIEKRNDEWAIKIINGYLAENKI